MEGSKRIAIVILAAGKGKRMMSDLPKVLHTIAGRPMLLHVIDTVRSLRPERTVVVTGYRAHEVEAACAGTGVEFVRQTEQLGTGHAVMQTEGALAGFAGTVVVLNGDVPGLRARTIREFVDVHRRSANVATVLTATVDDAGAYGRIVRGADGRVSRIVEYGDATEEERAIHEVNSGLFCFDAHELFSALRRVDRRNAQNEYYLTDLIGLLRAEGRPVGAHRVQDAREVAGVNNLDELEAVRRFVADGAA